MPNGIFCGPHISLESLAYSGPVLLEDYHLLEKIGQVKLLTCTGSDMGYMCVISLICGSRVP